LTYVKASAGCRTYYPLKRGHKDLSRFDFGLKRAKAAFQFKNNAYIIQKEERHVLLSM
jgi:hypothetical protein